MISGSAKLASSPFIVSSGKVQPTKGDSGAADPLSQPSERAAYSVTISQEAREAEQRAAATPPAERVSAARSAESPELNTSGGPLRAASQRAGAEMLEAQGTQSGARRA